MRKVKRRVFLAILLVLLVVIVVAAASAFRRAPSVFSVVVATSSGDLELTHFDLGQGRAVVLTIPKDTEVQLAMKRGTLRARSVARLMELEGLPGQLLVDTVMKTLSLPVDYWAKGKKYGTYFGGDVPFVVRLAVFVHALRGLREERISLGETSFLVKKRLVDGEDGYVVSGYLPLSILSLFADPAISGGKTTARLVNSMGEGKEEVAMVANILEVLGAKAAPPVNADKEGLDCIVKANDKYKLARLSSVFDCEVSAQPPEAFDVELILGSRFWARF